MNRKRLEGEWRIDGFFLRIGRPSAADQRSFSLSAGVDWDAAR
jgi:hypothetical protein